MDVTINENAINVPVEVSTWGELLDWIETEYLRPGQCITRVFLGDNEEVNYRSSLVCGQSIADVGSVSVESGDFDIVVRESLTELSSELENSLALSRNIVRLLENRNEEEAFNQLALLLDSVRIFFTVFSEDLGWVDNPEAEISRPEFSAALERALGQLISAQENRYWVAVCDVLEYEINPILESWQKLVGGTCAHIS
jgi:hypothetical protein